jgi:phosphatidylglycerophosphatase A
MSLTLARAGGYPAEEATGPPPSRRPPRSLQPRSRPGRVIEASDNRGKPSGDAPGLLVRAVATAAGAGFSPFAPGTVGALVGVALFFPLASLGPWLYALATVGLLSLGVRVADEAERCWGRKDDGRITIDEVVGQLLALFPLVLPGVGAGWLAVVTGFVAFRVFDVWKPAAARRAERLAGGAGVMLDDVVAGAYAAPVAAAAAWLAKVME